MSVDLARRDRSLDAGSPAFGSGDFVSPARTSFLGETLSVVRRRKWIILAAIALALVGGLLVTLLMRPQYTANSLIEIQRETGNVADVQAADPKGSFIDQEFYATQYGLLQSRALAERIAVNMRLYNDPAFFAAFDQGLSDEWFQNGRPTAASTQPLRVRIAGELLLANFTLNPGRLSRLVELSFTSSDPALSKRILDAWTRNFIEATLERRMDATSYARNFLERRLAQLRARIDTSERQLVDYASAQGIVTLPSGDAASGGTAERSLIGDDLASLNRELAQATADRVRAQSRLGSSSTRTSESLTSTTVSALRQRRAELTAEYARLMTQFEPGYPPAAALRNQIAKIDDSLGAEDLRIGGVLRENYAAALSRENALKEQVGRLKSGVLDLRRRSIAYNIIQRDADTNRQLYDALLQRYKAIGVAGGIGATNIAVVDPAEAPRKPSRPRILMNMLLALIAGLGLGAIAAWAMEQLDQAISDPSDVEKNLNVPLLGTVPRLANDDPIAALRDRKSITTEAYQSSLTRLSFATDHGIPRVLAVTSSQPAEGKTTTSYALAVAIARARRRVVLIDADMRSPSLHHLLGLENARGLSNFLAGDDQAADAIHPTEQDGLVAMLAGPQPPSAPELLSSDRLERLIAQLSERFDHIVFDAPPVMGLADAPLIASRVGANIFIVEAHRTAKKSAETAIARLRAAKGNIIGAMLTKFDSKRAHYGYGYGYGYSYGSKSE